MTFSKILTELRKEHGLTQVQMSERLGVTQSWYSRLESGLHPLNSQACLVVMVWRLSRSQQASARLIDFLEDGSIGCRAPQGGADAVKD